MIDLMSGDRKYSFLDQTYQENQIYWLTQNNIPEKSI